MIHQLRIGLSFGVLLVMTNAASAAPAGKITVSSTAPGYSPEGPVNGDRFSTVAEAAWKGGKSERSWWWQVEFPEPRAIGAILQINGDHVSVLRNAPRRYVWRWSDDGVIWRSLKDTETLAERRLYRIHRLAEQVKARFLRLQILEAEGEAATLREVEFYAEPKAAIAFPDWVIAVVTLEESALPGVGQRFLKLAKSCSDDLQAQEVWLGSFDEVFVSAEPRPLCAFLTGNSAEWCQKMQQPWRGTQEILKKRNLPIWAACGGAQGLAILEEVGLDRPWDCPRCRDPKNPLTPIYTHIGHTGTTACGDYSKNIFERGKFNVLQAARDPVFDGLPQQFDIMESHCGQIDYVPRGWTLVVTRGQGAHTRNQCLRVKDRYIYAAQFHMEMEGTTENSRKIMANFLTLARQWGGYNPKGKPVAEPAAFLVPGSPGSR